MQHVVAESGGMLGPKKCVTKRVGSGQLSQSWPRKSDSNVFPIQHLLSIRLQHLASSPDQWKAFCSSSSWPCWPAKQVTSQHEKPQIWVCLQIVLCFKLKCSLYAQALHSVVSLSFNRKFSHEMKWQSLLCKMSRHVFLNSSSVLAQHRWNFHFRICFCSRKALRRMLTRIP